MHGASCGAPSLRTSTSMFRELDSYENLASIDQAALHGASQVAMTFGSPIGLANWSFKPVAISPLYQSNLSMLADLSIGEVISVFFKKPSHMCPVIITTAYHAPRLLEQLAMNEHKYTAKSALVALSAIYLLVSNYWEPMKSRMNASPASFDIQKALMELLQVLDRVIFRFYTQVISINKDSLHSSSNTVSSPHQNGTLRGERMMSPSKAEPYATNLSSLHGLIPATDDANNTPLGTPHLHFSGTHPKTLDSAPLNDGKSRKVPKLRVVLQMSRLLIDILYRSPFQCFIFPYRCWLVKETQPEFRQMLLFCTRKDRQIRGMTLSSIFEAITSPGNYGFLDKTEVVLDKYEMEKSIFLLYFWFCDIATCSNEMALDMSMLGKMELVGLLCLAAPDSKCLAAGLSLLRHLRLADTDKMTLQLLLENHTTTLLNNAMSRLSRREPDIHQRLSHLSTSELWERFKGDHLLWYYFLAELCKAYSAEDHLLGCATTLGTANFDALNVVMTLFEYYSTEAINMSQSSILLNNSPTSTTRSEGSGSAGNDRFVSFASSYVAGYLLLLFALPHERQVDFVGRVLQSHHFHNSLVNAITCKWAIFAVQSANFHTLPIFVEYTLQSLAHAGTGMASSTYSSLDRGEKSLPQNFALVNPYHAIVCSSILGELVHAHIDRFETFTIEERTDKSNPKQRRFTRLQRLVDQLSQLMSLNMKILSSEEGPLSSLNLTLRTYCFSQAIQLIIALALVQAKIYDVARAYSEEMVQEILGAKLVWISKSDKLSTIQFLQVEVFNHNVACCTYLNQVEAGNSSSQFKPVFLKHHRSSVSSGSKNALLRSASNGSSHQHILSGGNTDLANSSSLEISRQHSSVVSPGSPTSAALNLNRVDTAASSTVIANGHSKASTSSAAAHYKQEKGDGVSQSKHGGDRPKSWAPTGQGSIISPAAQGNVHNILAPPSYSVQAMPSNGPSSPPTSPGSAPAKSLKGSKSRTPQPVSISVLDALAKPVAIGLEELSGLTLIAWETLAQIGLLNAMELPLFSSSTPLLTTQTSQDPSRSRSVSGSSVSLAREKMFYSTSSTSTNDPYDPSFQFTPRGSHVHQRKQTKDHAAAPAMMQKLLGLDKMRFSLLKWLLHYQRRDYKVTYESLFNLMLTSPDHRKNYIYAIAANVVALPETFSPLINNSMDSDTLQDPELMLATYTARPMNSANASHLIYVPKISSRFFSLPLHLQLLFPCVLLTDTDRITRRIARDMLRAIVAQHPEKQMPQTLRSEAGANIISDLEGAALATAGEIAEMFASEVPLLLCDCLEKIVHSSPLEQSWLAHLVISFGIHVTPLTNNVLHALYDATKSADSRLDATFGRVWGSFVHTVRPTWRDDLKLVVHFLINDVSSNRSSVSKILLAIYEVSDEHALRITSILLGVLESKSIIQTGSNSSPQDLAPSGANGGFFDQAGRPSPDLAARRGTSHSRRNTTIGPTDAQGISNHYTTASLDTQQTIEALVTIIDSNADRLLKTAPRLVLYCFLNFRDSSFGSLLATILERASLAQDIPVPIRVDMCSSAALLRGNVLAAAAARTAPTSAFSTHMSSELPPTIKRRSHHYSNPPTVSTLQPLYGAHSQSSAASSTATIPSSPSTTHSALNSARGSVSTVNRFGVHGPSNDGLHDLHSIETTYDDPKDWTFATYVVKLVGWLRMWDPHFASRFFDVVCEYVGKCANKDIVRNHGNLATALQIYRTMLDDVTWASKSEDVSDQTAPLLILITDLVTIIELEHHGNLLSESCLSFNADQPLALEKSRYHESLELSETLASFTRSIFSSSSPHTFWALVALLHSNDRNLFSYAIRAFWMLRFHTLVLIDGPKFESIPSKYWQIKGITFTCAVDRLLEALNSDDIASEEPNVLALALTLARSDLKLISGGKDSTLLLLFVSFVAFFWNSVRTPSASVRFVCHSFSSLLLHLQQKHGQLSARNKPGAEKSKTEKLVIPAYGGSEGSPYRPLVDKSPRPHHTKKDSNKNQSKVKTEKQIQSLLNDLHNAFDRYVARPTQSRLTALVECISEMFLPAESQLLTDTLCLKLRSRPAQAPALLVLARIFLELAPTTEHFPKLIATAFELSMDSRFSGISFELQRLVEVAPLVSVAAVPVVTPAQTPKKQESKRTPFKSDMNGKELTPKQSKKLASSTGSGITPPSNRSKTSPVPPITKLSSMKSSSGSVEPVRDIFASSSAAEVPSKSPKSKSKLSSSMTSPSKSPRTPKSSKMLSPATRSPSASPSLESHLSQISSPTKIEPSTPKKQKTTKFAPIASSSGVPAHSVPPLSPSSYKVEKRQASALEDHALHTILAAHATKPPAVSALSDSESYSDDVSHTTFHCMATHMLERVLDALEGETKKLRNDLRSRANSVAAPTTPSAMSPVGSLNLGGLLRNSSNDKSSDIDRDSNASPTPLTPYQPLPTVHTDDDAASELEVATFMAKQKKKTFFRRTVANNRPILDSFVADGAWPSSTGSGMLGSSEDSEDDNDSGMLSPITHRSGSPLNNSALLLPYNTNYNPKVDQEDGITENRGPSSDAISNAPVTSRLQPNVYQLVRIDNPLRLELDQASVLQLCNDHLAGDAKSFKSMRDLHFSALRELCPHVSSSFGHLPSILKLLFNLNEISERTLRLLEGEEQKNPGIFAIVSLSSPTIYLIYIPPKDVSYEFEEICRHMCHKILIEAGKSHFFFTTDTDTLRLQSIGVQDPNAPSDINDELSSNKTSETPTAVFQGGHDHGQLSRRASLSSIHAVTSPQPIQVSRSSATPLNIAPSSSAATMSFKLARPTEAPLVSSAFQIPLPSFRPHATTPLLAHGASNLLVIPEKIQQNTKLDMSSLIFGPDAFEISSRSPQTSSKADRKLGTPSKSGTKANGERTPSKIPTSPVSAATGAVYMQSTLASFLDGWIAKGGRVKLFPDFVNDVTQMIDFFRRYSAQVDAEMVKVEQQLEQEVQSLETDSKSSILAMIEYFLKTVCPIEYRVVHQFTSPGSTDAFDEVREAQVAFFQTQLQNSVESVTLTDSRRKYYEALWIINLKERKLVSKGKPRLSSAQKAEFIERLLLSPRAYKRALSKISDKAPLTLFVNENLGNEFLPIVTAEIQDFIIANYNAVLSNAATTFTASHRDTFVVWAKQHYEIDARQKLFDLLVPAYNDLISSNSIDASKSTRRYSSSSNADSSGAHSSSKIPNALVLTIYRFTPVVTATTSARPSKRKEQGAMNKQPLSPSTTITQRRLKSDTRSLRMNSPRSNASQSFELTFVEEKIEGSPRLLYSSYHIAVGESETTGKLVEARSKPFWTFTHSEQLLSVMTVKDGSVYSFVYDKKVSETVVYVGYSKDLVARKSEAARFNGLCTHIVLSPRQKLLAFTVGNFIRVMSVDSTFVPIFEFEVSEPETHIVDIRFAGSSRLVVFFSHAGHTYFQVYFMELVTAIKAQNSHNSKAQKGPRVYIHPSPGRLITPNGQYLILLDDMLCAQVFDLSPWLKPPNFVEDEAAFTSTFSSSNATKSDIAPQSNASSSAAHSTHSDLLSDSSSITEKDNFLSAPAFTLMLAPKFHSFVLPSKITLLTVSGQLYLVGLTDEVLEFLALQNLPGLGTTARSLSHTPAVVATPEISRNSLANAGRSTSSLPVTAGRSKDRSTLDTQIWALLDLFAEVKGSAADSRVEPGVTEIIMHFVVNGLDTNGMARHSLRRLFKSIISVAPKLPRSFSYFVSSQASLELLKAPLVLRYTHKQAPPAIDLSKWLSDMVCGIPPQVVSAHAGTFTLKALRRPSSPHLEDDLDSMKKAHRRHDSSPDFSAASALSCIHALLNDWQGPVKIVSIVGTEQRYETMAQAFNQVFSRFKRAQSVRLSTGVYASTFEQADGGCLWVVLDAVWPGDAFGVTHFERQILLFLCAISSVLLWHASYADSNSTISQLLELLDLVSEQSASFKLKFDAARTGDVPIPLLFTGKLYVLLSDVVASAQAAAVASEFKETFRKVKKAKRRGTDFCTCLFGSNLPSLFLYPDTTAVTYKSSVDTLRTALGALQPSSRTGAASAATIALALETTAHLMPPSQTNATSPDARTLHREKHILSNPTASDDPNTTPSKFPIAKTEMPPIDMLLTNLEHAVQCGVENDGHHLSVGYGASLRLIDDPVVQIGGLVLHDSNFDMYSQESIDRIVQALKEASVPKTELHYELSGLLSYLVNRRLSRIATWMDECLKTPEKAESTATPLSSARAPRMTLSPPKFDDNAGRSVDEDEDPKPIAIRVSGEQKEDKNIELEYSASQGVLDEHGETHDEDSTSRMLKSRQEEHKDDPKFEILVQSFDTLREQLLSRWEICSVKCGECGLLCSIPRYFHEKVEADDEEDVEIEIVAENSKTVKSPSKLSLKSRSPSGKDQSIEKRKSSKRSSASSTKRKRASEKAGPERKIDLRAASEAGVQGASKKYHELYLKHDCGTDHACGEACYKCGAQQCRFPFGHGKDENDNQVMHDCGNKHPCTQPCQYAAFKLRGCAGICAHDEKHVPVLQPHDCGQPHQCNQYCAFCDQYCKHLFTEKHRTHACAETECKHSCQIHRLCSRPCTLGHQHTEKHYCGVSESATTSTAPNQPSTK